VESVNHKLEYGEASSDDLSSDWDTEPEEPPQKSKPSPWRKVRNIVHWSPFVQTYKKQKYPWVQLGGHQGNFKSGEQGTILKKLCGEEEVCFQRIRGDVLQDFVPNFTKTITVNGEDFLEMEDLLAKFESPCVMDVKMGTRTYLEDELAKAREKPKLRKDMFEKMVQIDPKEPTEEENRLKAITKPRYMVWRETISSTASLGFRVEGVKYSDGTTSKDFKLTKTEDQVLAAFVKFIGNHHQAVSKYLERLHTFRSVLNSSPFFKSHELVGSSLLFVHDESSANVWMIDFAKTYQLPEGQEVSHSKEWKVGNHEDGYLVGVESLIRILERINSMSQ
jgi:1D-myo-inositol-triphosphate 3-kinase